MRGARLALLTTKLGLCVLGELDPASPRWTSLRPSLTGEHAEGVAAYGYKQAAVRRIIAKNFRHLWAGFLTGMEEIEVVGIPAEDQTSNSESESRESDEEMTEEEE